MDAASYTEARLSSEARWFDFSVIGKHRRGNRERVDLRATIEEAGESERVRVTVMLVRTAAGWKIDDIRTTVN